MNLVPTITVLMPVYNGETYLSLAIESILNQTYRNFEFLIINDGSQDCSEKIILSYKDSRIVYIKNEINNKLIKTLNKGIDLAKGKYIARIDCDDVALPDRLERQLEYFKKDASLDFLSSMPIHLLSSGKTYRSYRFCSLHEEAIKFENLFEVSFCHPCMICKTEILKKYKYLESPICLHIEDFELGLRLSHNNVKMYYSNDSIMYYRKNENGVSLTNRNAQIETAYNLSSTVLNGTYSTKLNKEAYFFLIKKRGWESSTQLADTCRELDNIRTAFYKKWNISKLGKNEINSWIKYRKTAYWLTAAVSSECKTYAIWQLIIHITYWKNSFLRKKVCLLIKDKLKRNIHTELVK